MQGETGRLITRSNVIHIDRPDSMKHVDLHIYIIPKEVWKNNQNLAENDAMTNAVSVGFVRVPDNLTIADLRRYIFNISSDTPNFPENFLYLRSVGRCLTKVKQQQEKELKVKNYRPPMAFAPEIYLLEDNHKRDANANFLRGSPINRSSANDYSWQHADDKSLLPDRLPWQNSTLNPTTHSIVSSKVSPRRLAKVREEQERLYLQQEHLARKRRQIENQQEREQAAVKIQTAFRNYRQRRSQPHEEDVVLGIDRLEEEANKLTSLKEAEERNVLKFSHRLDKLRTKRFELETNRDLVIRRLQQLQAQIAHQRRKGSKDLLTLPTHVFSLSLEKDLWKQKYILEKNRPTSNDHVDLHDRLDQVTMRLNHTTKARQQAEYESRLLRQELQQISSTLNGIQKYRFPKQATDPISLNITLKY
ncbi:unnamed protein product [Adineta ricciae]|uniref:Spermatogenesis-associated protein 1 C-terminal domain-containing protein n=1 Tax=Adineta ricciae TaxID=249248 RepID=A0A814GA88_ADIRI|nr:unnamed protein product [Adineta ricciae]